MTDEILKNATARLANSIKNPLASIMLQTKLIKKARPELEDEVNIINDECRRISTLLSTMEMFTEDPVGKKIDIDLILFINDVILRHTDISINFNTNLKKVMISFDNNKLRYILDSIIQNSIDACQKTDEACIKIGVHSLCSNKINY